MVKLHNLRIWFNVMGEKLLPTYQFNSSHLNANSSWNVVFLHKCKILKQFNKKLQANNKFRNGTCVLRIYFLLMMKNHWRFIFIVKTKIKDFSAILLTSSEYDKS